MLEVEQKQFDFSEAMQVGLLRAFCENTFFEKHCDTIQQDFFESEVMEYVAGFVIRLQKKFHEDIQKDVLVDEIEVYSKDHPTPIEKKVIFKSVDTLFESRIPYKYLDNKYREWMKHQSLKKAILTSVDLLKQGRWQGIRKVIDDAFYAGDGFDLGHFFLRDVRQRVGRRLSEMRDKIPTLIPQLDHMLQGGAEKKQLAIVMGQPKMGKSFFLVNIGKAAVICGYNVAHYTLEMSEEKITDRYDASFSGIETRKLIDMPKELISAIEGAKRNYGNQLVVKEFPTGRCTVDTIRSHQKRLIASGFKTDVLVLDYADLLKASQHYESRWSELGETFKELRGISTESDLLIWSGTQVHRLDSDKKVVTIEDIAESYNKVFVVDLVIALCQTPVEKRQHIMRLHLAAGRNLPSGLIAQITTDFDRAQFAKVEGIN